MMLKKTEALIDRLGVGFCLCGKLVFQPAGDITECIQPSKLIKHFMPCIFIKDDLYIFNPCATIQIDDTTNAFTIFAYRVLVTG